MLDATTTESATTTGGWAPGGAPGGQRPVEDVVAAGVLLDVSRVLGGLLGLARPALGVRTERVTRLVRLMARALDIDRPWEFEVAARLSQIGWLTVPTETHAAALRGDPLPDEEWCAVASHPLVARDLLAEVGRLDGVREMIARQREPFAVARRDPRAGGAPRQAHAGWPLAPRVRRLRRAPRPWPGPRCRARTVVVAASRVRPGARAGAHPVHWRGPIARPRVLTLENRTRRCGTV